MPYLNIAEVESALSVATSPPFTAFTQLISLPNLTWEGRQCHAIKIANGSGSGRPGVYFLGGVHSREWGSPDILINFVEQLEQAFRNGTALTYGSKTFSADDIQTIVNALDIIVFPQANPDGRNSESQRPWPADKVERWSIDRLIPYAKNARTHSDAQIAAIAASIKEWGWTTPALVGEDGGLIAGHARILAARQLGIAEIPVMVAAGWSEAQKRAYVLADNQLAITGSG
jgi:hypothetical protein